MLFINDFSLTGGIFVPRSLLSRSVKPFSKEFPPTTITLLYRLWKYKQTPISNANHSVFFLRNEFLKLKCIQIKSNQFYGTDESEVCSDQKKPMLWNSSGVSDIKSMFWMLMAWTAKWDNMCMSVRTFLWPLLLTWINFNPSMDK